MATNYTNFYYDPYRQGYSPTIWRTLWGSPAIANNTLKLNNSTIVHFADVLRGQYTFNIKVPTTPVTGNSRSFGLYHPGRNAYILFEITGATFRVKSSNGTDTTTTNITWSDDWASVDTKYTIRWEAGTAKFYINDGLHATISDVSVPGVPLSIYAANNTVDNMTVNYIDAQGIQSYLMIVGQPDTIFAALLSNYEAVTVSENVSIYIAIESTLVFDAVTVSEGITLALTLVPSVNDAVTVAENVALTIV